MDWEALNDTEKEIALVATNIDEVYAIFLTACHACANAAIKGTLTGEKAIKYFLPVVQRAFEWEYSSGVKYYDVLTPLEQKRVAAYLYESEKDEMISEMENHTVTYRQKYIFVNFRHIKDPGLWTFAPGKRAKFVARGDHK
nr:MAG TPA: hypothetical protein [Caudoviricetes sp.]